MGPPRPSQRKLFAYPKHQCIFYSKSLLKLNASFKNKSAYFQSNPLTVNLSGERAKDWGYLYPFVEAIRIPEVVDCFRENGLSFMRYIYCKNYAVRKLLFNLVKLLINPSYKGLAYVKIKKHIINNLIYPSIYIAPIFYIFRKILKITKLINK